MPQHSNGSSSKDGIDIREALEILSLRKDDHSQEPGGGDACPCCTKSNLPHEQAKSWGQRIDMATSGVNDEGGGMDPPGDQQLEQEQAAIARQRKARQAEWKSRMDVLSTRELIRCVIQTQEDRVAAYRMYDRYVRRSFVLVSVFS